jgi:hypothetical protein
MLGPEQVFPRREGDRIEHRSWRADLATALRYFPQGRRRELRLQAEAEEMARHFPRWLLTVTRGRERVLCTSGVGRTGATKCGGMLVFDRGLRCVACERKVSSVSGASLAWFGLLPPVGIDGLHRLRDQLATRPPPLHRVGRDPRTGTYLLVPLVALYPADFPEVAVRVAYLPGFFQIPGVPGEGPSHQVHLLGGGFMCLFAGGEWQRRMTCREVLQQRAYAHVIKLLNFADGKRAAFAIVS